MKLWQASLIAAALLLPLAGSAQANNKNKGNGSSNAPARQAQAKGFFAPSRGNTRQTFGRGGGRTTRSYGGSGRTHHVSGPRTVTAKSGGSTRSRVHNSSSGSH